MQFLACRLSGRCFRAILCALGPWFLSIGVPVAGGLGFAKIKIDGGLLCSGGYSDCLKIKENS